MENKIFKHVSSFNNIRRCSNLSIGVKTEIFSVFIRDLYKKQQFIQSIKLNYLQEQYENVIQEFLNKPLIPPIPRRAVIWIMWWQGEEKMPPLVKACFQSVKKHVSGNVEIVLLTERNYMQYVRLSEPILQKFQRGLISLTHLSDIIRMCCLAEYGGMWLDSTIYVNRDIPDDVITGDFFSLSTEIDNRFVSMCKWSSFAIGGRNVVFDFMRTLFFVHWQKYETFIDFFFIDYGIRLFYENSATFKQMVDEQAIFVKDLYILQEKLDEVYDEDEMLRISENAMFCKLSWKGNYKRNLNGKKTFYGYLISKVD